MPQKHAVEDGQSTVHI